MRRLSLLKYGAARVQRNAGARAFTLVEMMTAAGLFCMVALMLVGTTLFGLRYDELVNSKLGASETSRRSFDQLTSDIRAAKVWQIGQGSKTNFTPVNNGVEQTGNALQLSLTSATNFWIRYYFDTNLFQLCRYTNGAATHQIIAQNLTNTPPPTGDGRSLSFHSESYCTNRLFDYQFRYTIVATLEFAQYQYPLTKVGPGYYYNYYRMQFKVASHNYN